MNAARRNARRLASDARMLAASGRYATAASLAALAIEEAGKVSGLRAIAVARTDDEAKREWKEYRSHRSKNAHWLFPELVARGARTLEQFRELYEAGADHPIVLDKIKQIGFYTDCSHSGKWLEPEQLIEKSLAEGLVRIAELLATGKDTSVREIELWVEHLGPVWRGRMAWMKKAVSNWYRAMQDEGLVGSEPPSMDAFLGLSSESEENGA